MDPDTEIIFDFPQILRQYKSGRVVRLTLTETIPPSTDQQTNVTSKDVIVDPDTNLVVRLYLPNLSSNQKLPIYVYYHGGGFMAGSAFHPADHKYLNQLVSEAKIMAVSVNYCLAPEHLLPIAHEDSWIALKWVLSHSNGGSEPWLTNHGDFGRIFIAGCSAGGNIAHNMAIRAGNEDLEPGVTIQGLVLIHPFFAGTEAFKTERMSEDFKALLENSWRFMKPDTIGLDDPLANPFVEEAPDIKSLGCKRVIVCVSDEDWLGFWYYLKLKESGWEGEVELHESKGEGHGFHLVKPDCEKATDLKKHTIFFLNKII
ncbi:hypothetical protein LUZ60_001244 [Juncus effusus]|nr:hypothetical protein LUZ60_001244 [Juncus effusus]